MIRITRDSRRGDEAGFTLIELLVAMTLLLLVMTALLVGTTSALRSDRQVGARSQDANVATSAMNRMTKELREAILLNDDATTAVTAATTTSVTFTSEFATLASGATAVKSGPVTVTLSLGTDTKLCPSPDYCLLETDAPTTLGTASDGVAGWVAGATSTTKVLAHNVSTSPAQQLFSYYATTITPTGNPAAPLMTTIQIATPSGAVASGDLSTITTMDIYLAIDDPSDSHSPATSVENRVYMPNTSSYAVPAATS